MGQPPQPSDEALLAAWRAGDEKAFEHLFRRWQTPLARHLTRMLGDPAAAEDVVIETFLRLHRHRERVRPDQPLKPFVWTIARNLARSRLRRDRLWGWLPLVGEEHAGRTAAPADRSQSEARASEIHGGDAPDLQAQESQVRRKVGAAFSALPQAQREACSLRLFGELTLEEIAAVTGASVGTVKSRLYYGLRRLRSELADLAPGKD